MEIKKENNLPDIIRDRKALPVEIKEKMKDDIFFNCLIFMIMLIITLIINTSFKRLAIRDFDRYIDVVQIVCGLSSVIGLEIAYRKDSGRMAIYALEILAFSICVLFVPYMYTSKYNLDFLKIVIKIFFVYYLIKSIITLLYKKHSYLKENMSDIKELVKEEKEGYIDEESTKTLKEQKIKEERRKKSKEENVNNKNSKNNVKNKNAKKVEELKK